MSRRDFLRATVGAEDTCADGGAQEVAPAHGTAFARAAVSMSTYCHQLSQYGGRRKPMTQGQVRSVRIRCTWCLYGV